MRIQIIGLILTIALWGCTKKEDNVQQQIISPITTDEGIIDLSSEERKKLGLLLGITLAQIGKKTEVDKILTEYKNIPDQNKADVFLYENYMDARVELEQKALAGDYQSQRNTAYAYANDSEKFGGDHVYACGWYLIVLSSDAEQVDFTDKNNVELYCSNKYLTDQQRQQAFSFAQEAHQKIYKNSMKFKQFYGIETS